LNQAFKALSDPTRRKILQLLATRDMNAGEIAAHFNATRPTLSHHLDILKSAGLVTSERNGQHIIYSSNLSVMQEVMAWFTEFVEQHKERKGDDEPQNKI
jgi:ArsR family transcriptional regulator, arsenate/arsenite/antimonite-responsive transcriptional repressor